MNQFPEFDAMERSILDAAMIYRYGQPIRLEPAEIELKLAPADETPALCPGFYWNERGVQFVICKTGPKRYRSYFFYHEQPQYRIGEQDYEFLEDCVRSLLELQADHDARRRQGLNALTGAEAGEEYFPPLVV
jgi:hypothetical protein